MEKLRNEIFINTKDISDIKKQMFDKVTEEGHSEPDNSDISPQEFVDLLLEVYEINCEAERILKFKNQEIKETK